MNQLLISAQDYIENDDIQILKEFLTDTISGNLSTQSTSKHCLYFYGSGNNGKSKFLREVIDFVGNDNICYGDNHSNRKLRVFNEVEGSEKVIKRYTSGDDISFQCKSNSTLICVGNKDWDDLPDEALKNRMTPIKFINTF